MRIPALFGLKVGDRAVFADQRAGSVRSLTLRTLEDTDWLIGRPDGAASRLGLPRTSLISKMKKLGISRPRSSNAPSTMAEECLTGLQVPSADHW
jgi:hypothetical protein